jgi:glucose/arabinose dehydrogenase
MSAFALRIIRKDLMARSRADNYNLGRRRAFRRVASSATVHLMGRTSFSTTLAVLGLLAGPGLAACGDDTGAGASGASGTGGSAGAGGPGGGGNGGATGGGGDGATDYSCEAPTGEPPALTLTQVAEVSSPVQAKSPPGSPELLFIAERGGVVHILEASGLRPQPFLDLSDIVLNDGGEQGLLGLAFHPDYTTNGRFFVHYSDANGGDSVVAEYARGADAFTANPTPVREVLRHYTDESNHNGGAVEFGPDGFLYISLGDGGAQGDPGCDALDPSNLLGKIVRLDVDASPAADGYPAAAGNPGGLKQYHVGMRNPWRITFDPCTGTLYVGDVGQNTTEEISVADASAGALNFGWPIKEGTADHGGYDPSGALVPPIAEYPHENAPLCNGSVTGGYVYRGFNIPGLRGWYLYGDFCSGKIFRLRYESGSLTAQPVDAGIDLLALSAFGQDGFGEMYALELDGRVFRIDPQ